MKIVVSDKQKIAKIVARRVMDCVSRGKVVLGLATGKTMIPVYKEIVRIHRKERISFRRVVTFNLDEYVGSNEMRRFMDRYLFNHIDIKEENVHFLDGHSSPDRECLRYRKELGRIDLQILGIGRNGHIAFNEPGSRRDSRTRKVKLTAITRRDNPGSREWAMTMGIKEIMDSREIILVAFGNEKAQAISKAIEGDVGVNPASYLQEHKKVSFFVDKRAARFIS